jgi:hypothetical protein
MFIMMEKENGKGNGKGLEHGNGTSYLAAMNADHEGLYLSDDLHSLQTHLVFA